MHMWESVKEIQYYCGGLDFSHVVEMLTHTWYARCTGHALHIFWEMCILDV